MTITNSRQLHTIVSRDIIRPSSPTPSHLKTYNLSVFDQIASSTFLPIVVFYQNNSVYPTSHDKTLDLKNSLSQTLTKYYPYAGTHAKIAPSYVDCNDDGAEFLEARINSKLSDFLQNSQHEDFKQLFPYGRVWNEVSSHNLESDHVVPLYVQVNHFKCGGVAVAMSLSHKIGDASSLIHFLSDWAKVTHSKNQKFETFPIESPNIINFQSTNMKFSGVPLALSKGRVTKSFIFPNSKIDDLKLKVKVDTMITNPTRVEALTWLLSTRAIAASTKNNSGSFKPTGVILLNNVRGLMIERLPAKTIGNMITPSVVQINNESEIMSPGYLISELKKQKTAFGGIKDIETLFAHALNNFSEAQVEVYQRMMEEYYMCTSLCRFPIYEIDFGWGKPIKTTFAGNTGKNIFTLMDAENGDGIEAYVCLDKQDMDTFQADPDLLCFC